jgi:hypothetical protein
MAKQTFTSGAVLTASAMQSLQQTAMGGGSPNQKTASYVLVAADAGTVIQMNSSSSTSITVNTGLFSAGDSVQIQNIGSGTCTVTAGTATVNTAGSAAVSQYDGGFLYFTSASSAIWFDYTQSGLTNPLTTTGDMIYSSGGTTAARLAIGSTGQTLVVSGGIPAWATPSSGGMTLLSTNTANGSASYSFTSISSSHKHLLIVGSGIRGADTVGRGMTFTLNNDTGLNYNGANHGTDGLSGSVNGNHVNLGGFMPFATDGTSRYGNFELIIYNYADTAYHPMFATAMATPNGSLYIIKVAAQYNSTTAISRVDLSSGAGISIGTFKLFGVS